MNKITQPAQVVQSPQLVQEPKFESDLLNLIVELLLRSIGC